MNSPAKGTTRIGRISTKERENADILVQVAAVNAALNGFSKELLSQHVRTCVADDLRAGGTQKLDELLQLLPRLMK